MRLHGAKVEPKGTGYKVPVSHQHGKDIPDWLFVKMLRQSGLRREECERLRQDP